MKNLMMASAAIALALGAAGCKNTGTSGAEQSTAASTIAGSWKADADTVEFKNDTSEYVLADGEFDCKSCIPPYTLAADGNWHKVDRPGVDGQMIKVVDDNSIKTASRLGDKDLGNATWSVGDDGKSLTVAWQNLSGDEPVNGSTNYTRTAAGPAGSHAISGKWEPSGFGEISDAGLNFTYALDGDQYSSSGNGSSFSATLGGDPVAIEGDNSGTMVAVSKNDDNSYTETYTRDGKTVTIVDLSVDGDTLSAKVTDPRDNSEVNWTAARQ